MCYNILKTYSSVMKICSLLHWVELTALPKSRVRKYAKFGVFDAKIVQMTPLRLWRESLRLQKFSVT